MLRIERAVVALLVGGLLASAPAALLTGGPGIQDGDPYPYTQTIQDANGSFDVVMQASLNQVPTQLYVSSVNGLGIQKKASGSTTGDYRQINADEFLEMTITNLAGASVQFLGLQGNDAYFPAGRILRLYKNNVLAATINCNGSSYYDIVPPVVAINGDKVSFNPNGDVRLGSFTVAVAAPLPTSLEPYVSDGSARALLLDRTITEEGHYYVVADWSALAHRPDGVAVLVGNQGYASQLYFLGETGPGTVAADLDLRILQPGDTVQVVAGLSGEPGEDAALWTASLDRYDSWSGSRHLPAAVPWAVASPLAGLDVHANLWPKNHTFRNDYLGGWSYDAFINRIAESLGHAPKCYSEEVVWSSSNMAKMQQYALENPARQALIHWDAKVGKLAKPAMPAGVGQFKPYHFRYHAGTYLAAPAGTNGTQFTVESSAPFAVGTNDVAIVVPVDPATGKRLFGQCELVVVTAIDGNVLTVQRNFNQALFGYASAGDFPAGSYVAPSINAYGGADPDNTLFSYNFSASCPRDPLGRNAGDISAEMLAAEFGAGGDLERFHGIMFDVLARSAGASEDCDLDGFADGGLDPRGIDLFHLGTMAYARKLRGSIPGRIITYDGSSGYWPADQTVFNGIESEGLTSHNDSYAKRWSKALNYYQYTERWNPSEYKYNFCVPKQEDNPPEAERPLLGRFHRAALTALGVVVSHDSVADAGGVEHARDEFRRGADDVMQWLGAPVGGIVRPALAAPDLLAGAGLPAAGWISPDGSATVAVDPAGLRISPIQTGSDHALAIKSSGIAIPEGDLVIRFEGKGRLPHFPSSTARNIKITVDGRHPNTMTEATLEGAVNDLGFSEVTAYYRGAGAPGGSVVVINLVIEGAEEMLLRNFTVHSAADVLAREFENGVVLCNPSQNPYTFNLAALFPGQSFRRMVGQPYDDPVVNDGTPVGSSVQLDGYRGLFLVKSPVGPGGTTTHFQADFDSAAAQDLKTLSNLVAAASALDAGTAVGSWTVFDDPQTAFRIVADAAGTNHAMVFSNGGVSESFTLAEGRFATAATLAEGMKTTVSFQWERTENGIGIQGTQQVFFHLLDSAGNLVAGLRWSGDGGALASSQTDSAAFASLGMTNNAAVMGSGAAYDPAKMVDVQIELENGNVTYTVAGAGSVTRALDASRTNAAGFSLVAFNNRDNSDVGAWFDGLSVVSGPSGSAYDAWAFGYNLSGGFLADDDNDGLSNLAEYGLGGDPTNTADQGYLSAMALRSVGGTNWLEYIYARRTDPASGLAYWLELNGSLTTSNWVNGGYSELPETGVVDENFEAVTNHVPMVENKKFIRLRIGTNP